MSETLRAIIEELTRPDPVRIMIAVTVGLLLLATLAVIVLARIAPRLAPAELRLRVRSWWVMVLIFVLAISVTWWLSIIFIALLSYIALKEFFTLVHLRSADRRAVLLAYLAIPVQYWWVYVRWYAMFIVFIPVFMFLIIPFRLVLAGDTRRFMTSMGKLHWGLMAFVFGISHLAYMLVMEHDTSTLFEDNRGLVFFVVFLTEFNDVLQYLFGKAFGRHQLAPTISPKKTWEGFLGGLLCTSLLAVLLRFLTPMDVLHAVGAGALIGILGPIGDIVISAIKRDVGVKDSGNLIPGHGGVLDRIDSLCFTVPVFFHYIGYFY